MPSRLRRKAFPKKTKIIKPFSKQSTGYHELPSNPTRAKHFLLHAGTLAMLNQGSATPTAARRGQRAHGGARPLHGTLRSRPDVRPWEGERQACGRRADARNCCVKRGRVVGGGARAETPPCVVGAKAPDAHAQPGTGWHPHALVKGAPLHPGELNSCPGPPEHTPLSLGIVTTRRADIQGTTGIF